MDREIVALPQTIVTGGGKWKALISRSSLEVLVASRHSGLDVPMVLSEGKARRERYRHSAGFRALLEHGGKPLLSW